MTEKGPLNSGAYVVCKVCLGITRDWLALEKAQCACCGYPLAVVSLTVPVASGATKQSDPTQARGEVDRGSDAEQEGG